jgi:hypothetical protein
MLSENDTKSPRAPLQVAPVHRKTLAATSRGDALGLSASGKICGPAGCVQLGGFPVDILVDR